MAATSDDDRILNALCAIGRPENRSVLQRVQQPGAWLITVVATWGSSPRPAGSLLLIDAAGRETGSVSGGCVEADLVERCQRGEFDGDRFRLSNHRGQVVVLDFWASWCAPCMQTMPKVDDLIAGYDPTQVKLVTVNLSDAEDKIRLSLKRLNIRPEVALDIDGIAADRYSVEAIPMLVVINQEGVIQTVFVGGGDVMIKQLSTTIDGLLQTAQ